MKNRCTNPNVESYPLYGGRGIVVCDRWEKYSNFIADMGPSPSPEHTLDRIDNDGNYEPRNCRWANRREQGGNRRNNVRFTINGVTKTQTEWCEQYGVGVGTFRARLRRGLSPMDALTPSVVGRIYQNKTGVPGGRYLPDGRIVVVINIGGRMKHIGIFNDKAKAMAASKNAKQEQRELSGLRSIGF